MYFFIWLKSLGSHLKNYLCLVNLIRNAWGDDATNQLRLAYFKRWIPQAHDKISTNWNRIDGLFLNKAQNILRIVTSCKLKIWAIENKITQITVIFRLYCKVIVKPNYLQACSDLIYTRKQEDDVNSWEMNKVRRYIFTSVMLHGKTTNSLDAFKPLLSSGFLNLIWRASRNRSRFEFENFREWRILVLFCMILVKE